MYLRIHWTAAGRAHRYRYCICIHLRASPTKQTPRVRDDCRSYCCYAAAAAANSEVSHCILPYSELSQEFFRKCAINHNQSTARSLSGTDVQLGSCRSWLNTSIASLMTVVCQTENGRQLSIIESSLGVNLFDTFTSKSRRETDVQLINTRSYWSSFIADAIITISLIESTIELAIDELHSNQMRTNT